MLKKHCFWKNGPNKKKGKMDLTRISKNCSFVWFIICWLAFWTKEPTNNDVNNDKHQQTSQLISWGPTYTSNYRALISKLAFKKIFTQLNVKYSQNMFKQDCTTNQNICFIDEWGQAPSWVSNRRDGAANHKQHTTNVLCSSWTSHHLENMCVVPALRQNTNAYCAFANSDLRSELNSHP